MQSRGVVDDERSHGERVRCYRGYNPAGSFWGNERSANRKIVACATGGSRHDETVATVCGKWEVVESSIDGNHRGRVAPQNGDFVEGIQGVGKSVGAVGADGDKRSRLNGVAVVDDVADNGIALGDACCRQVAEVAGVDAHDWCAESPDDASDAEESAIATDAKSEVGGIVEPAERIGRGVDVERLFEIRAEALFDGESNVGRVRSESIDKTHEGVGVGVLMSATKKSYCNHSWEGIRLRVGQ